MPAATKARVSTELFSLLRNGSHCLPNHFVRSPVKSLRFQPRYLPSLREEANKRPIAIKLIVTFLFQQLFILLFLLLKRDIYSAVTYTDYTVANFCLKNRRLAKEVRRKGSLKVPIERLPDGRFLNDELNRRQNSRYLMILDFKNLNNMAAGSEINFFLRAPTGD